MTRRIEVDCCVTGGGPAGIMAGLLFARAGCRTLVLEKHADFLRYFRGDTVHPSTLEVLKALGLLDALLSDGTFDDGDLVNLRKRRLWPVHATQFLQVQAQNRILAPILVETGTIPRPPLPFRLVSKSLWLRRIMAKGIGLGIRPEHVRAAGRHRLSVA